MVTDEAQSLYANVNSQALGFTSFGGACMAAALQCRAPCSTACLVFGAACLQWAAGARARALTPRAHPHHSPPPIPPRAAWEEVAEAAFAQQSQADAALALANEALEKATTAPATAAAAPAADAPKPKAAAAAAPAAAARVAGRRLQEEEEEEEGYEEPLLKHTINGAFLPLGWVGGCPLPFPAAAVSGSEPCGAAPTHAPALHPHPQPQATCSATARSCRSRRASACASTSWRWAPRVSDR